MSESIALNILENSVDASKEIAREISELIIQKQKENKKKKE